MTPDRIVGGALIGVSLLLLFAYALCRASARADRWAQITDDDTDQWLCDAHQAHVDLGLKQAALWANRGSVGRKDESA